MRWKLYLIGIIAGCALLGGALVVVLCCYQRHSRHVGWGDGVAVIPVDGTIVVADEIVEAIEEVRRSHSIKAVVLRVNSPGGSVGASQEIYHALRKLRAVKPVVTSMGDVAASGGYYIACATQRIFAMPGTITGSIGVRMSHLVAADLFRWARLAPETLKSGALKDAGSIYRPMSEEERGLLQGILTDMHAQFKEAVATGRNLPLETVTTFADGRVLTGNQAKALHLVDEFGGLPEAVAAAGVLGGIKGEPKVVEVKRPRPWWVDFVWGDVGNLVRRWGVAISDGWQRPMIGYVAY